MVVLDGLTTPPSYWAIIKSHFLLIFLLTPPSFSLWLKQSSINSSPLPSPPSPCWALVCQHQTGQWTMGLCIESVTVFGLVAHDRDWDRIWTCFMSQSFLKTSSLTADPSVWLPKWTHLRSEQVYCQHSLHVLCGVVLLLFKTWQF